MLGAVSPSSQTSTNAGAASPPPADAAAPKKTSADAEARKARRGAVRAHIAHIWKLLGALVLLAVMAVLVACLSEPLTTQGWGSAATVLALAGVIAVAIERTIENFWTLLSHSGLSWSPFGTFRTQLPPLQPAPPLGLPVGG
jgi:hypothetical protein